MLEPIGADFETHPIFNRPDAPPKPVGLSLKFPAMAPFYLSWGHPAGNNCTEGDAKEWLARAWDAPNSKVFHNAKFDLGVATERWDFRMLDFREFEDTMFLAFLADPHAHSLGLKPLAEEYLGMPPEERDAIADWVHAHSASLKHHYPDIAAKVPPTRKSAGAWIFAVPAHIVAPYANGDVVRTVGLFHEIAPMIRDNGLWVSYERKKKVVPIFMENERMGMRVDLEGLHRDHYLYERAFDGAEEWLRQTLRAPVLNFDADQDVAQALLSSGAVKEENFPRTDPSTKHPNGQYSVSKDNLTPDLFEGDIGAQVASVLGYRNRLKTTLTMFIQPWLEQAHKTGGTIHTNWNLTRDPSGHGTRSGRPSTSSPNLLNISKSFEDRDDGYIHPVGMPALPLVRKYILPDAPDHKIIHRDLSQQELRIFAHYEQGALWQQYNRNPFLDVHIYVGEEIQKVAQRKIQRSKIKTLNFQGMYGGGVPALMRKARVPETEAKQLKAFHNAALPGRQVLNDAIKVVLRRGLPVVTWGGRWYFEERPGVGGKSKLYKMINYLIQPSAADLTEECLIDWYHHPDRQARFMITVYDEINGSAPAEIALQQLLLMREVMEQPRLSVPMVSDGKIGDNWGELEKCLQDRNSPPVGLTPLESKRFFQAANLTALSLIGDLPAAG